MKDTNRTTSNDSNDNQLLIQLPEHEPLISAQAAVVLLRLIRHVKRNRTDALDQQEKS